MLCSPEVDLVYWHKVISLVGLDRLARLIRSVIYMIPSVPVSFEVSTTRTVPEVQAKIA